MTIYLALLLPIGSSELPNLLLHQDGFTTPPRHRGVKDVAPKDTILLFTFGRGATILSERSESKGHMDPSMHFVYSG